MDDQASPNPDEQTETPEEESDLQIDEEILTAVSYTHLTLPTS